MREKSWKQTASDIEQCFKEMKHIDAEFKNLLGYKDGEPVCAMMFGIQNGILHLYNITVNPEFRGAGIMGEVISFLMRKMTTKDFKIPYDAIRVPTLPENERMQRGLDNMGFANLGFNDGYVIFEYSRDQKFTQCM